MKTRMIKATSKTLAVFLAGALFNHHVTATALCGWGAYLRKDLAIGCKEGNWTVVCLGGEGNCQLAAGSGCYEYEAVSSDCGDICGAKPNATCAYSDPMTVVVTGRYGTPECSGSCVGMCTNVTPYPPGTTATYYDITEGYCQ